MVRDLSLNLRQLKIMEVKLRLKRKILNLDTFDLRKLLFLLGSKEIKSMAKSEINASSKFQSGTPPAPWATPRPATSRTTSWPSGPNRFRLRLLRSRRQLLLLPVQARALRALGPGALKGFPQNISLLGKVGHDNPKTLYWIFTNLVAMRVS